MTGAKKKIRARNPTEAPQNPKIEALDMRSTRSMTRRLRGTMTGSTSQPQPQDPPQPVGSIEEAPSDSPSTKKKTRGPTRCFVVWNMPEGQRIPIATNTLGQPVGDNVSKLTNFLGTIARNGEFAPLTFSDWREVPVERKDFMWGLVMSKFDMDRNIKSWVLRSIGTKWRDWKCELKKRHYLPHETDDERLADLDERVQSDQWKALIEFWNSEEGKARNKKNMENRRKQKIGHAAGSKSFARIREEEVLDMRSTRSMTRRLISTMTGSTSQPQPQYPPQPIGSIEEAPSVSPSTKRKTRGPTRCFVVWNMREGQRIPIATNTLGQPVGDNVSKLTNFLGTIARNGEFAPLTFSDWREVPVERKDYMWGLVMSKFDMDTNIKSWVLRSIGKKWRDWKCELKKLHYLPHETDDERLADLDERVQSDQWKALIEFWNSEEGKARNKKNMENRRKQKIGHAAGSKSFARIREEERVKRAGGEDPTREEMFILTHTRKDGTPVDEASSVAMFLLQLQLNERISQQPEASHSSTARNDVFSQVMGEDRHGRVRTYGLGPSPSDLWGITPNPSKFQRMASAAPLRDKQYEGLQAEILSLKETVSEMSSLKDTVTTLLSALTNPNINLATVLGVLANPANPNLNQPSPSLSHLVPTPQRPLAKKGKNTTNTSAGDVTEVLLMSVARSGVTVAKGAVLSKDPLTKVGRLELGIDYWEVSVQVAMVPQEALIRPHGRYKTIADVVGTSIAWPASLCVVVGRDG
ncbi:uncharacterized protein LOC131242477 isoform X2 [Magnolia sinica]|uniref:uncharacterized protein LOC131242477 isoform X2 n=1 Tax=Magnolia sinica TaxID=86752 RepID=UPI00265B27B0|nr:uncharacterized protein LOC131242477 isoform X2 [Magnolia sinica]